MTSAQTFLDPDAIDRAVVLMPMIADFTIRLAGGLMAMLLITSWREVPLAFFRTHSLVALGLLVVAVLSTWAAVPTMVLASIGAAAFLAYLASAFWGLGIPRVAYPVTAVLTVACFGLMVWTTWGNPRFPSSLLLLNGGSRLASSVLMGATLTAMLLGHYYLTAPSMTIRPLQGFVRIMAIALVGRTLLAGLALWVANDSGAEGLIGGPLFFAMRWGMGIVGPAVATTLTWKTVQIRSTQSATGILYIAMTLVLVGELTGLICGRQIGIEF